MITAKLNNGKLELTGQQGTTWNFDIELFQDDAGTIPLNINGFLARGQFRQDKSPDAILLMTFTCTVLSYDAVNNPNNNKVNILVPASESASLNDVDKRINNLPVLRGFFDVEVYKLDGMSEVDVMRPLEGILIITPEITR